MKALITYIPQSPSQDAYAFDESGERVAIEFGWFGTPQEFNSDPLLGRSTAEKIDLLGDFPEANYVRLNGVIHRCWGCSFDLAGFWFWAEPCQEAVTVEGWKSQIQGGAQ